MPKTIVELLKHYDAVLAGYITKIWMEGDNFCVRSKNKRGSFMIDEYTGESEEEAVKTFIKNESKK